MMGSASDPPRPPPPFVIAACHDDKDDSPEAYTNKVNLFVASRAGPHVFGPGNANLTIRRVRAVTRSFLDDVKAGRAVLDDAAARALGLDASVAMRLCHGTGRAVEALLLLHASRGAALAAAPIDDGDIGGLGPYDPGGADGWSHRGRIYYGERADTAYLPRVVDGGVAAWAGGGDGGVPPRRRPPWTWLVRDPSTGTPFGPMLVRISDEGYRQEVRGAGATLDTKRDPEYAPLQQATVYAPWVVLHNAHRTAPRTRYNSGGGPYSCCLPRDFDLRSLVTRPEHFDARRALLAKRKGPVRGSLKRAPFAAFLQQNCGHATAGSGVRNGFFAYFNRTSVARLHRPVHALGKCPEPRPLGAPLPAARAARVRAARKARDAVAVLRPYKFALVFENTGRVGYMTEKLVNAYLAEAVPVYFTLGKKTVFDSFNPEAMIFCELPAKSAHEEAAQDVIHQLCDTPESPRQWDSKDRATRVACRWKVDDHYSRLLAAPYFRDCVDKVLAVEADDARWRRMVAAPLARLGAGGAPAGVWSMRALGGLLREVYARQGYRLPSTGT